MITVLHYTATIIHVRLFTYYGTNGLEKLTENDETKLTFEVVFMAKGMSGT